ncbi:amidase [Amycolatopsis rhabdoformis]|uniref:Amidase n=1 Tax=Amycolatopsis rhabdoformis TaxID=1448059 RepID=A0ABZ1IHT9_9PSEU|nr:amidase [Amycolatopsis rhabdoformis]WSE33699.1 amidase [Amycolatopsis rhabdoformis]
MQADWAYATVGELSAALREGRVSAAELTESAIARIEKYDPELNAVCAPDFDRARAAAREADAALARGEDRPLLGIPITVKESFNVAGLPTTWGIPPFKDFVADEDALPVARLKAAGAIVLGKTNVPLGLGDLQTYNAIYGTTNNPWDVTRTPGGSSGGSAAALAAGFGALSIGSDIAGSLRAPAHFTGVYAHKPSQGLLPSRGHTAPPNPPLPSEKDLTVIGPMARTASDLALVLDLLLPPDPVASGGVTSVRLPPARHAELSDHRVLVLEDHPLIPTSAGVRAGIRRVTEAFTRAGASVAFESPLLPDPVEAARTFVLLFDSVVGASHPAPVYEQLRERAADLAPDDHSLAAEHLRGTAISHRDWIAVDAVRQRHRQAWRRLFEEFDVVVCPPMPTPAFPHDHSEPQWGRRISVDGVDHAYPGQLVWAGIASMPGLPATIAPVGLTEDGLPTGVQLLGPAFEDRTPIHVAELLEAELGGFRAPPL